MTNVLKFTKAPTRIPAPIAPGLVVAMRAVVLEYMQALNTHRNAPTIMSGQYLLVAENGLRMSLSITQQEWSEATTIRQSEPDDCA